MARKETTMTTTIETRIVRTAPGMEFDVSVAGDPIRPLVLMLHGFCVSRHYWESQAVALAEAGYFAAAPNQRGYAPGARPDPAERANYIIDVLIGDAMAIVSGLGHGERRFHLAGHDWGGSLSWNIAERWPERLGSLTMLSRPHPLAFNRAMRDDPEQPIRSAHHKWLLEPGPRTRSWRTTRIGCVRGCAATGCRRRRSRSTSRLSATVRRWRLRSAGTAPAARACAGGPTRVPTLLIWGDADDTVGRMAAEGTAEYIAGPYTFAPLAGVGHYAADQVPEQVNALMLAHLARHPV